MVDQPSLEPNRTRTSIGNLGSSCPIQLDDGPLWLEASSAMLFQVNLSMKRSSIGAMLQCLLIDDVVSGMATG